jgi:hypothetical protein
MENKKAYTPPTLTNHGKIEQKTQGLVGTAYETYGKRTIVDDPKNPGADD